MGDRAGRQMPQATRSNDHRTYRCYLRGPDGFVGFRSADLGHFSRYPRPPVAVKRKQRENAVNSWLSGPRPGQPIRHASGT